MRFFAFFYHFLSLYIFSTIAPKTIPRLGVTDFPSFLKEGLCDETERGVRPHRTATRDRTLHMFLRSQTLLLLVRHLLLEAMHLFLVANIVSKVCTIFSVFRPRKWSGFRPLQRHLIPLKTRGKVSRGHR